jgi:2,4-dienoyl-CoA reductase-like NADH-dependent reductase (Old Yellow Enzyme family)
MRHFVYKTLDALQRAAEQTGAAHVHFAANPQEVRQVLAQSVRVGALTVGNSIAIQPMEGCDGTPDGNPDELTWRRYERFARGGAKLIWFEATAVRQDGRANMRQLWITPRNVGEFARLLARVRELHRQEWGSADDLLLPIQLTHSGRYSVPRRIIAYHNPYIDQMTGTPPEYPVIADDELERLEDDYVIAAGLALDAGFQAVDIKAVHGYLLSELLGAKTRDGRYGGPLENRLRFIRNVIGKLRAAYGRRLLIAIRMNAFDGVPFGCEFETPYLYGWGVDAANPLREDLREVKQAISSFRECGVELLNISLGSPYYNPHIGRPFEKPDEGNYEQPEHPLTGVDRHFRIAAELQRAFPNLPIVGTGYSWLQKYAINAGAHNIAAGAIRFLGVGRGALAYPDFARDALEKGELDERRCCKTLTYCTYLMRQKFPSGCPPFDKEGYGQIIKLARHAAKEA